MARLNLKMPSFNAVAAGATAVCNLPIGLSYHQLLIRYRRGAGPTDATLAQIAADIDEIRLMIDGDAKITVSGAELQMLNAFYGIQHIDGVLPLLFSRPWQRTVAGEEEMRLGTGGVQSMTLEIDLNAAAVTPALTVYAVQGQQTTLGRFMAIRRFSYTASAIGEFEISDLPRGNYGLTAIHIGSGNVDSVEVEANQRRIFESDNALAQHYYGQTGRVPQTGYFHIDFGATNQLGDMVPLAGLQDFRQKIELTAAGSFKILLERVEGV